MKLSVKIALSVVLIVAIAVGAAGYVVISTVTHAQLRHQVEAAADETQLMCSLLGSSAVNRPAGTAAMSLEEYMSERLRESPFLGYRLTLVTDQPGNDPVRVRIAAVPDGADAVYDIVVICRFLVDGKVFYLQGRYDVTSVFALRRESLTIYRTVYIAAVGISFLLSFAIGTVLTAPVRKLSRSAKQIAGGNYRARAKIGSSDEIGILAQQFNEMAYQLEQHIDSLEKATQHQREFTASFAHELKTPLTSIIGYADTLRSRRLPEKQQFEAASFIFTEGQRLETMSHSLLRLFSLDSETPQMQRFSALLLAKQVEQSIAFPLRQRQLVMELRVQDDTILGERSLLTILLYNLIDNARKASPPGSKITLYGIPSPDGYRFAVKDRGRGIPAEALDRIMEPFYMVDKSRSRAEGGAGLGLALCQRIAQLHGTVLKYDSREGRGTIVTFTLKEAPR